MLGAQHVEALSLVPEYVRRPREPVERAVDARQARAVRGGVRQHVRCVEAAYLAEEPPQRRREAPRRTGAQEPDIVSATATPERSESHRVQPTTRGVSAAMVREVGSVRTSCESWPKKPKSADEGRPPRRKAWPAARCSASSWSVRR